MSGDKRESESNRIVPRAVELHSSSLAVFRIALYHRSCVFGATLMVCGSALARTGLTIVDVRDHLLFVLCWERRRPRRTESRPTMASGVDGGSGSAPDRRCSGVTGALRHRPAPFHRRRLGSARRPRSGLSPLADRRATAPQLMGQPDPARCVRRLSGQWERHRQPGRAPDGGGCRCRRGSAQ